MMEFTFYKRKDNEPEVIKVSEKCYERLANIGFAKKVEYENIKLIIDEEEYEISGTKLNHVNKHILLLLVEEERHKELRNEFSILGDSPTIKEVRESYNYIKELTNIYELIKSDIYQYFSYE